MILICFGTRPEWIKMKPIIEKLPNAKTLFTGQHPDLLSEVEVDYRINIGTVSEGSNRVSQVISDCMLQFPDEKFKYVLVHGDTVSALGCALAAYSRKLKVVHVEAGLRSWNLQAPYPEEGFRQMISRISDINFTPTTFSANNLYSENVQGETVVVGNSVLDNLKEYKNSCYYSNKVLVTLHRWENHKQMAEWFQSVEELANRYLDLEFIIPLHHHPDVRKHAHIFNRVKVVPALTHKELVELLTKVKLVITDSGGIQEEATFFDKKVIVCRETTERPEGIGTGHLHLCKSPAELPSLFHKLNKNYEIINSAVNGCIYGNGDTGLRIAHYLLFNEKI